MLESMNNNQNSKEDEPQGSCNRVSEDPQQDPRGDPTVAFVHSKLPFFMHLVRRAIIELKSLMNQR